MKESDQKSATKDNSLEVIEYTLISGIKLGCVGTKHNLDSFYHAAEQKAVLEDIQWILSRFQIFQIYCHPLPSFKHWKFVKRFEQDLASIDRLLTQKQYNEAAEYWLGREHGHEVGITMEELQEHFKKTRWYKMGWSL